ncbi:oligomeric complex COG6-domain-containing protein [Ilyonectria robusta]|uniref:oligomeric complex COG6-domain-containing protein n=1 Tax=Ilyonectria robusta TaxID=1079257 RepID=UPI001E8CD05C|nr:oligomeric complex COG6-domain-containing protein [Ilyonectria robusta]KAH8706847.1 oligomeric complex COG6-domain-containing protein [Ilyonectria robusta]
MSSDHSWSVKSLPSRGASGPVPHSTESFSAPHTALKGLNPLTSKVTSVLSTTHSDTEFRDALLLLDQRGIQNDAETRRRLRLDLQKEVIDSNAEVITEFGRVAEQLRRIKTTLDKLNTGYEDMKGQVVAAHTQTSSALSEASSLLEQRKQVEVKQELLGAFKKHFIMSENEVAALTMTAEPVDDRFFESLSKAKKISRDCEILLGFEKQTLGLELMEQTSKNINLGFQKLYKWIQREFKTLNLENPQMNASIRRALRVLAERPSLFQNCLDFFAEARERILSDSFYVALTGASPSGVEDQSVKPIDMTAHDPLRYVGDILAWIHSATVSEREALEILFVAEGEELAKGLKSGRDAEIWRLVADDDDEAEAEDFNALKALHDLVDRDISGAARVLRQRVEQVIQANEDIIPAYKLANLINFYRITFQKTLGPGSNLVELIGSLETEALRQFRALVRDHIAAIQGEFQHAPSDLGPPLFLQDSLKQLNSISKTYDSSLSASEDREAEFENVLAEAFEPFLAGCENMAKTMEKRNGTIFLINCMLSAAAALEVFDFTQTRSRRLREKTSEESKKLVGSQYAFFRKGSGLEPILNTLHADGTNGAASLDRDVLSQASQVLDDFLPSALMDAMENLKHLQDSKLARQITEEAAEKFCDDFEQLEEEIADGEEDSVDSDDDDAMLRNKGLAVLQKTYDESYLSCSTAVYYEGQGNEIEAMRHWRSALDQIYDYQANRAVPALQDALKELELQCKERIDLLEALRISRNDDVNSSFLAETDSQAKGGIGQGTIPAVTYSELSRPALPQRPSLSMRRSSENALVNGSSSYLEPVPSTSSVSRTVSPKLPPRPGKTLRSPSPEKHTMRTTLRSGKVGERPAKMTRKSSKPAGEGPSKAATLAWSALGSKDKLPRNAPSDAGPTPSNASPRASLDQGRKPPSAPLQWDSHSRRLVVPREGESSGDARHSDEYFYARPSLLSVSAASSALGALSLQDPPSTEPGPSRSERLASGRVGSSAISPRKSSRQHEPAKDPGAADDSGEVSERRTVSDSPAGKTPAVKRFGGPSKQPKPDSEKANRSRRREQKPRPVSISSGSGEDSGQPPARGRRLKPKEAAIQADSEAQTSDESPAEESPCEMTTWKKKKATIMKSLPPGIDETAAKQILNDIVVQGDEVHWGDVAGLEIAKNALRETVVYPFLRPDLFMGLREPARGMLLFGPPGTGKTMLARAVATESQSTFFSISASSLTSKYLGESEKLVRALFGLARTLAPSIIFVDEIDSLLSQRSGSGEHEATRRIKTEFLIQWSDLQRAAAGKEVSDKDKERGDANRVLVLAATNLPWAIDEAARRRFVRRQYIPLPEPTTRETQLRTLLGQQKHDLSDDDIHRLVELTDGFSGSDITALAKDAAMGPLRSLGEALLHMTMDQIRSIGLPDFEASLNTIRPSVSKSGLKEYEDWAKEFGERGG